MRTIFLPSELALTVNRYCADHRITKARCFICDSKFEDLVKASQHLDEYVVQIMYQNEYDEFSHGIFEILNEKEQVGIFHSIQKDDELFIICGEKADVYETILLRYLQRFYPKMHSAFVHSDGIYRILEQFESIKGIKLGFKKVISKQIFGEDPRTEITFEVSKEFRDYPNFRDAYTNASEQNLWIDKIKVYSEAGKLKQRIQFSISRRGEISFDKGTFDVYFPYILAPIIEYSKERKKQFEKRSRSEHEDKKPRPLIVKFGNEIFEKDEIRHKFIELLDKYPNCNYSIIHNGNPHVYVSILDRNDNSSFSIRTVGTESMLLIPQIKTSSLALMRFSEFLVTSFYEGEIQNYEAA